MNTPFARTSELEATAALSRMKDDEPVDADKKSLRMTVRPVADPTRIADVVALSWLVNALAFD